MTAILEVKDLVVTYGKVRALDGVSIQVSAGNITCVLGANGAGKSTLLNTVMGANVPREGSIRYAGSDVTGCRPDEMARRGVSLVPEGRRIFPGLTVMEHLQLGGITCSPADKRGQVDMCFELFPDLKARTRQLGGTLSGGQQQMLAVSRALMSKPELLILDEPSLGVSPRLTKEIYQALRVLRDGGTTILLVEQYAHLALAVSEFAYVLSRGLVELSGAASTISENDEVQRVYLGVSG